ncbi:sensor histidine kinase [Streptomyces sp. NPDC003032]
MRIDQALRSLTKDSRATGLGTASRVAGLLSAGALATLFVTATTYVLAAHIGSGPLLIAAVLFCVQLLYSFPGLAPRMLRGRKRGLMAMAVLTYIPFMLFGKAWLDMPGFLSASTLLALPGALSWPLVAVEIASADFIAVHLGFSFDTIALTTTTALQTALIIYGLSRLSAMVREAYQSRAGLTQLAIAQERLRFARDLHDQLGYSLTAIALKCELTHRLVSHRPSRAEEELAEVLRLVRQTSADVRCLARGHRDSTLASEAAAARSLLESLGIRATIEIDCDALPPTVDSVLAIVLREALTNTLGHSHAETVTIAVARTDTAVRLSVVNDGAGRQARLQRDDRDTAISSGIANLTARIEELGGRLTAGMRNDDSFALVAELELPVHRGERQRRITAAA